MEYLVSVHDKNVYYVSSGNPMEITEPCEECGKRDEIILSWEDGKKDEALDDMFSKAYKTNSILNVKGTREDLIFGTRMYYAGFRELIGKLSISGIIDDEHRKRLTKENHKAEKEQLKVIRKNKPIFKL